MKYFYRGIFNPQKLDPLNVDSQSVSLIPSRSKVLELGCADGFMGEYLIKKKGCFVVGFEKDSEAVRKARLRGLEVIEGDLEDKKSREQILKRGKFDFILASSVIEHLKDPQNSLKNWREFLKNNGFLIISTPNIVHWSARLKILLGRFEYEDYGIFDEDHLRFYTINSFENLVNSCGYKTIFLGIDSVGGGYPKISKFLSKFLPNLFAYQIIIKAKKS